MTGGPSVKVIAGRIDLGTHILTHDSRRIFLVRNILVRKDEHISKVLYGRTKCLSLSHSRVVVAGSQHSPIVEAGGHSYSGEPSPTA